MHEALRLAIRFLKVLFASCAMTLIAYLVAIIVMVLTGSRAAENWLEGWGQYAVLLVSFPICWRFLKTR